MAGLVLATIFGVAMAAAQAEEAAVPPVAPNAHEREVADAARAAFAKRLFGAEVGAAKTHACYQRRYDAAHLARHPAQTVQTLNLLVSAAKDAETTGVVYEFGLHLQYRNASGVFSAGGGCSGPFYAQLTGDTLRLGCSVDCEGGTVSIFVADDGQSVRAAPEYLRMTRVDDGVRDDVQVRELPADGADDRLFRLDRVSLDNCKALMPEPEEPSN